MNSCSLHRSGILLAVMILSSGCGAVWQSLGSRGRVVDGEWEGRLVSQTVHDIEGRTYDAAALDIDKGPRMPYRFDTRITDEVETSRIALLNRTRTNPIVLWDAKALKLPLGSRVRIRGSMSLAFMMARQPDGFIKSVTLRPNAWESDSELVILVDGNPVPVRD